MARALGVVVGILVLAGLVWLAEQGLERWAADPEPVEVLVATPAPEEPAPIAEPVPQTGDEAAAAPLEEAPSAATEPSAEAEATSALAPEATPAPAPEAGSGGG